MVGGDGGGPQLVDVATVVHVDGPGLIELKSNDCLRREYLLDVGILLYLIPLQILEKLLCTTHRVYSSILLL